MADVAMVAATIHVLYLAAEAEALDEDTTTADVAMVAATIHVLYLAAEAEALDDYLFYPMVAVAEVAVISVILGQYVFPHPMAGKAVVKEVGRGKAVLCLLGY